jgi:hypothetical protein
MNRKLQAGTTTVEFAIVGAVALLLIFTVIEFGRVLFTLNMLDEGARRSARVAAVCAIGDSKIAEAAAFVRLPGISTSNVVAEYLDGNGAIIGSPTPSGATRPEFVRVRIVNYDFPVALPFIAATFSGPEVSATLPAESLGIPHNGAAPTC